MLPVRCQTSNIIDQMIYDWWYTIEMQVQSSVNICLLAAKDRSTAFQCSGRKYRISEL